MSRRKITFMDGYDSETAPVDGSIDEAAIHTDVNSEIVDIDEKTAPVGADEILIEDSEDNDSKKSVKVSNLPISTATQSALDDKADSTDLTAHEADTSTHGVTEIVGKDEVQVLTNKSTSDNFNIGGNSIITGDLTVNGTTTTVNSDTLEVVDANITVNKDGDENSANLGKAGITVEMSDATDTYIGFDSTKASKWTIDGKEIVTDSDTQTLTTKTIDADSNTISNLEVDNLKAGVIDTDLATVSASDDTIPSAKATKAAIDIVDGDLTTHESDTTTHGTTGNIVGTSDTQVLTNKDIDGGTASNSNRITLPKNTSANLNGLTDKEGTLAYDTTLSTLVVNDGSEWNEISGAGGGVGGINFCLNPDAEDDTTGWAIYNDGAVEKPIDGTGGTPTVSFSRITAGGFVLRGDGSFSFTKPASNVQGQGFSYDFTIDYTDQASMIEFSMDHRILTSQDYNDGDIVFYIYDTHNNKLIECADGSMQAGEWVSTKLSFQTAPDSLTYRLIGHVAADHTDQVNLYFDNVKISPAAPAVFGTPSTDWEEFTPTLDDDTNINLNEALHRRVGDTLHVKGAIGWNGVGAGSAFLISLPDGLNIDSDFNTQFGTATWFEYGVGYNVLTVLKNTSTDVFLAEIGTTNVFGGSQASSSDYLYYEFRVPIAGWSANVAMSETTSNRDVYVEYTDTLGQAVANGSNITFNTKVVDTHGAFNGTTFTAPRSGVASISIQYGTANVTPATEAQFLGTGIIVNGSAINYNKSVISGQTTVSTSYSASSKIEIQLSKGDAVTFTFFENFPAVNKATDNKYNRLAIKMNSGSQTIAASEKVFARYNSTSLSLSTGSDQVLIYGTKKSDTHNAYNTSTGIFECPRSGLLTVFGSIHVDALPTSNSYINIAIVINGTKEKRNYPVNSSIPDSQMGFIISGEFEVNKGDEITVLFYKSQGGTISPDAYDNEVSFRID